MEDDICLNSQFYLDTQKNVTNELNIQYTYYYGNITIRYLRLKADLYKPIRTCVIYIVVRRIV